MANVGIIRCEKNENRCPMTNCFKCMDGKKEGFAVHEDTTLTGVFTCKCPGDIAVEQAKILKAKGADAIHFCTCTFATKSEDGWSLEKGGFCDHIDALLETVHDATGLMCVKGSAHLPKGYEVKILK